MSRFKTFESEALESASLDSAYDKALKALHQDAVSMEEFRDVYDDVDEDIAEVERKKKLFKRDETPDSARAKQLSVIFEAIVHTQAELNEWLGPDVRTIRPSEYDDIKNGVDIVAEFAKPKEEASHLALAVDVTFGSELVKKLDRIKAEIEAGRLTDVKYFEPKLERIPRVIIGAEYKELYRLMELWTGRNNRELARHAMQFYILDDISAQLTAFEKFARSIGKTEIADEYAETLWIIGRISAQKEQLRKEIAAEGAFDQGNMMSEAIQANLRQVFAVPKAA